MAFVVLPLVFVFAFATHPGLLRPRILRPEQLIDRARGRRLLHAGHGLVTINTGLMIAVALHLGHLVTRHGAGWAGLVGTTLAVLGTVALSADKGALCLTMSALDGLSDDESLRSTERHAYLLSPSPARVAGWWVEGVLDSAAYPRSGRVLRSVGGVKGRGAIAERRPEGPPLTAAVESGHWRRRG